MNLIVATVKLNFQHWFKCLSNWDQLYEKWVILCGIKNGFAVHCKTNRKTFQKVNINRKLDGEEAAALDKKFLEWLEKKYLDLIDDNVAHFSPVYVIPKKSNGFRPILNLSWPKGKSINDGISAVFKRTTLPNTRQVMDLIYSIHPNGFCATIDLSDAWKQFEILPEHRKFFGWSWNGIQVAENKFPFGWSEAVRNFVMIGQALKHIFAQTLPLEVQILLKNKDWFLAYIDDFCVAAGSKNLCQFLFDHVMIQSKMLGLVVNEKKIQKPCQKFKLLGYDYDISKCSVRVTADKAKDISDRLKQLLANGQCKRIDIEKIAGKLAFLSPAIREGMSLVRSSYNAKCLGKHDYSLITVKNVPLLKEDWRALIKILKKPYWLEFPQFIWSSSFSNRTTKVWSDASKSGWGMIAPPYWCFGSWPDEMLPLHINVLEAAAIAIGLCSLKRHFKSAGRIMFMVDNQAVVYSLQKKSSKALKLHRLIRYVSLWLSSYQIPFSSCWLRTDKNALADHLSRRGAKNFKQLCKKHNLTLLDVPESVIVPHVIHQL